MGPGFTITSGRSCSIARTTARATSSGRDVPSKRRERERGDQVHLDGTLALSRTGAVEALREENAGVVHRHVHRAELIVRGGDQALAVDSLGQIRRYREGLAAALAELRGEGIEL